MTTTPPLYFITDGPPSHEAGRFVEVENEHGHGIANGMSWAEHPTSPGLWRLGPFVAATPAHMSDCSLHNGPAFTPAPCDCGVEPGRLPDRNTSEWPAGEIVPVCCHLGDDTSQECGATTDIFEVRFSTTDYMDYTQACGVHLTALIGDRPPVDVHKLEPYVLPATVTEMMEALEVEAGTAFERLLQERLHIAIQMLGHVSPWTKRDISVASGA